jgi:hypothetical protein
MAVAVWGNGLPGDRQAVFAHTASPSTKGATMNSNQQGQGSDKSQSIGQGSGSQDSQQSQSGSQGQQGGKGSQGTGQQSQSGGAGGQQGGGQAGQRKDFDNLMSQSDQSLRDSTMQQGTDKSNRGSGEKNR